MKRTDPILSKDHYEDVIFHLVKYKFASRFLKPTDDVLEVGCGTGYGSRFMSNYCHFVEAQDIDEESIIYARENYKKSNINFTTQFDLNDEKQYNAAVCFEVIEHMSKKDASNLLKKICLAVEDGGFVFISTPRKQEKVSDNRKKYHVYEYTYEEFKSDLEDVFSKVLIFSQIDESISTYNSQAAWYYVAICIV